MKDNGFRGLLVDDSEKSRVILTGIPYDKNASIGKGASEAPSRIRELSRYFPPLTMDGADISACKIFDREISSVRKRTAQPTSAGSKRKSLRPCEATN